MEKLFTKIEEKFDLKEIIRKVIIIFMIIQPILDIYMVLFDEKIQIVGVSLATIFRFATVGIMTILVMIYARKNRSTKLWILYVGLVAIYCIFHHINANKFNVELNSTSIYSPINELLYILRICVPIALIYIMYNIKLTYKDIKKIVLGVVSTISLVIIITNLLKISYISYSLDNVVIKDNMLSWFGDVKYNYSWRELTSRGLFRSGNQLSAILILLLPITIYIANKEKKIAGWIILILQLIAMLNISTRISVIGGIVIFVITILMIFFGNIVENLKKIDIKLIGNNIKKQNKNIIMSILALVVMVPLLLISPFESRRKVGEIASFEMLASSQKTTIAKTEESDNEDDICTYESEYIKNNYSLVGIQDVFILEIYPYTQDLEFWKNAIENYPASKLSDNRGIKSLLVQRVYQLNNNPMDKFFGESFTRLSSFAWPERDYESQFYSLGICGMMLFILPYFVIVLLGIYQILRNIMHGLKIEYLIYIESLAIALFTGYLSGHVLNEIFVLIFIGFVSGNTLNNYMLQSNFLKRKSIKMLQKHK